MKRLLSISTLYPAPGRSGFGRFVARQMEALASRGDWEVTVVNPIGKPPVPMQRYAALEQIPDVEQQGAVTVHHPRFLLLPGLSGPVNPHLIARAVLPLAQKLHEACPFDMVDAQFFYPDGPAAAKIAAKLGLPLAIKARGSDIHLWGERRLAKLQILGAAQQATTLLAVSRALARDMVGMGMEDSKISVHYTGLDRERFRPLGRASARQLISAIPSLHVWSVGRMLLSVGALVRVKGQSLAIRALKHLPEDVRLVIAGSGTEEAALRALVTELDLEDRVQIIGAVDHDLLPHLLSAADVMVLPSEREGLANAWIEALACGTPVVIPDVGGAREVVQNDSAGRIVERTPESIAQGVAELLANPPSQEAVAANAERFSWDANAAALAEIYAKAAEKR
ncbi:MAG: glycoside hydrolase [Novosphingobium sp. 17-62-19]|uniref:glycosyltransferase n=1 Tax=Novosphingobium sp. 17-62-19 TaxID=1970406 RepID=UPI000BC69100|nr:glycosyltransferase [Novosphingobium sp. 17-62-19]OYX95249.1 MAG: glycoside hydrolase [Novosphingobium sp. 35-62-5]OZA17540.1 MAG: glycoside hydrolase [Novosphingobium sp. 17-62-19]HQS96833.1 glycosyltransferase [Novosphingobium sp.]